MSKIVDEVLKANLKYKKDFGNEKQLPTSKNKILHCHLYMYNIKPKKFLICAIIKYNGRIIDDTIRSAIIFHKLLETKKLSW